MVAFGRDGPPPNTTSRRSLSLAQRRDTRPSYASAGTSSRIYRRLVGTSIIIPLNEPWQNSHFSRLGTETRSLNERRDWAEHHQGHNFGYIFGSIIGLIFVVLVGIAIYLRYRRRRLKPAKPTNHYDKVVLAAPSNDQEDPLLREPWKPEHLTSFTISPVWRNREVYGIDASGIIGSSVSSSIPTKDGPTLVYLCPPNVPTIQERHPLFATNIANFVANHEYPPTSQVRLDSTVRPSMDASNLSASDSDSLQVNIPWRDSLRFTPGKTHLELVNEPEPMHIEDTFLNRDATPPALDPKGDIELSSLHRRALIEAESESLRQTSFKTTSSAPSEKRNSIDNEGSAGMSEGSETASSLSSFARLKLRWTGSTPFLPLIEESSPLDTESLWARFRRNSAQSISISMKSHSSRKSSAPKTSSPLSPYRKSTSTASHLSSVANSQPPKDTGGPPFGIALNFPIYNDPSDVDRSNYPDKRSESGMELAAHTESVDNLNENENSKLYQPNKEILSQTVSEPSSIPFSPSSAANIQFSPDMNADELSPTLNNNDLPIEESSQEPRQRFKLTPDMPALTALPSQSSLWQSSLDSTTPYGIALSTSSLSLSDFPEPPTRRPYRPLPLRPLPRIPHMPTPQHSTLPARTIQSRIPPVPKSQPPTPPVNASTRPDFRTMPHMRRFRSDVDGHRRTVTTSHEHNHDTNSLHRPARSS